MAASAVEAPTVQPIAVASEADRPAESTLPASITARFATADELEDWDSHTVGSPNGHVLQSRAWGEYRAAHEWQTWHLVFDDGFRLLVTARPRSSTLGRQAYAPRGPVPEAHPELTAARAAAAADLLGARDMDSLVIDGETPASAGLGNLLRDRGFNPTDELQPSRHRMDVQLGPDDSPNSDEQTIFGSFGATTRNLIRQAERHNLRVLRVDGGGGRESPELGGGLLDEFDDVDISNAARVDELLDGFHEMLDATAERRGFALANRAAFKDWSRRALAAGHLFYLQAQHPEDGAVAGATFLRHGHRLTYSLAGDRAELRRLYPGAVRLLVWRAIQIALDERRTIVDLGGIDTPEHRGRPAKGEPTYGMYQFKESFGARWVELTGAHERTMRPLRSLAGRVMGRLARLRR